MNPSRLLRARSGRLYEVPLLFAFLATTAAFLPAHSLLKSLLLSALVWGGLLAGLFLLTLAAERLEAVESLAPVRRFLESRTFAALKWAAQGLIGGVSAAVLAAFLSLFVAPRLASAPREQLLIMRGLTAAGGLLGAAWVLLSARKATTRF